MEESTLFLILYIILEFLVKRKLPRIGDKELYLLKLNRCKSVNR